MHSLQFKRSVQKDFRKIGPEATSRVMKAIHSKLLPNPRAAGKLLSGPLGDLWSFSVGDYRVIYTINDDELWILVVRVGHCRGVYD